jgi:hypothetical protein
MNEPAHTPGPWGYTLGQVMRVTTRDGGCVAGVHRIGGFTGRGDPAVWGANARLIAAAPDLLDACQAAAFELTDAVGVLGRVRDACRAAASKALTPDHPTRAAQVAPLPRETAEKLARPADEGDHQC